jgi:hypothetical protein
MNDHEQELKYDPTTDGLFNPAEGPPAHSQLEQDALTGEWYDPEADPWEDVVFSPSIGRPPVPTDTSPAWVGTIENMWARIDGYVYVLSGDGGGRGYHKIGCARNVPDRMRALQVLLPWPTELTNIIRCVEYRAAESYLHRKYKDVRENGEWFTLSDADVGWIQQVYFINGTTETVYDMRWNEL